MPYAVAVVARVLVEHFRELWRYRALIDSLVRREVQARYRRSVLGFLWTFLNPLLQLLVYWLVFTRFTRAVDLPNYALFLFVGILAWTFVSGSIISGATSIAMSGGLVTRVCMPPQVLPAVAVISNLVNFLLGLPVMLAAAWLAGHRPGIVLAALPLAIAAQLVFLYGAALAVATLTVRFRDVQFLVGNFLMVWFFATPIAYPLAMVPERYARLIEWNPATSLIRPYQQIVLEGGLPGARTVATALLWGALAVLAAVLVFETMRDRLVEEI
jgi:ABC-type polysaccharide/polyol phosphate export permease